MTIDAGEFVKEASGNAIDGGRRLTDVVEIHVVAVVVVAPNREEAVQVGTLAPVAVPRIVTLIAPVVGMFVCVREEGAGRSKEIAEIRVVARAGEATVTTSEAMVARTPPRAGESATTEVEEYHEVLVVEVAPICIPAEGLEREGIVRPRVVTEIAPVVGWFCEPAAAVIVESSYVRASARVKTVVVG